MKILHCLNQFLPHHVAGTEVYVMALMKSLLEMGIHSSVIIPNYGKEINDSYETEGFKVLQYGEMSVIDRSLQMGLRKPDGLKNFERIIVDEAPDIIHFHELAGSNGIGLEHVKLVKEKGFMSVMTFHLAAYTCKTGTLMYKQSFPCDGVIRDRRCSECWTHYKGINGMAASLLNNSSSLLYALNVDLSKMPSRIATAVSFPFIIKKLRTAFEALVGQADALVVISAWYMGVLRKNTTRHDKIHFIRQGLPAKAPTTKIGDRASSPYLKLVFIGRISYFKGIVDLLNAIKMLPVDQVSLDIYGDTGEVEYIEECRLISASMANVTWKGRLSMKDVVSTLSCYDLLCLPSTICEMSPLVIQEAFAAGIPVLASDVYGNAEQIIDGNNGWLYAFKDVEHLKSKINMLISNRDLVEQAKKNIPVVKDFADVAGEYEQLYNSLMIRPVPVSHQRELL